MTPKNKNTIISCDHHDADTIQENAIFWWKDFIEENTFVKSSTKCLINSQDDFINILKLSKKHPGQAIDLLKATGFSVNLFIKHLCLITDFGGEGLKRVSKLFSKVFPDGEMIYYWGNNYHTYKFKYLHEKRFSNRISFVDGSELNKKSRNITELDEDVIMILIHAGASTSSHCADLKKCEIGRLLHNNDDLDVFVKQRYITASTISTGSKSNSFGHMAKKYALDFLENKLSNEFTLSGNTFVNIENHERKNGLPFDIIIEKAGSPMKIGIDISFQVTTSSAMERKAAFAKTKKLIMEDLGYKIAFVIDGAGNLERKSALNNIMQFSDHTCSFGHQDLDHLAEWVEDEFETLEIKESIT